jgi:hypothetical protein
MIGFGGMEPGGACNEQLGRFPDGERSHNFAT